MHRSRLYLSAATLLATSGCTHLETTRDVTTGSNLDLAVTGYPYALPALHYELAVEHSIADCPKAITLETPAGPLSFWSDVKIQTKVAAEPHYVAGERFLADYRSLASAFKTTGYGLETYPSGVLKSLNVSAEDQSGAVIKDVVSIGLSVAGLVGAAPPIMKSNGLKLHVRGDDQADASTELTGWDSALRALSRAAKLRRFPACRYDIVQARKNRADAASAVRTKAAELEKASRDVARFALIAASEHANHLDLENLDGALVKQATAADLLQVAQADLATKVGSAVIPDVLGWTADQGGVATPLKPNDPERFNELLYVRSERVLGLGGFHAWWKRLSPAMKVFVRTQHAEFAKAYGVLENDPPDEPDLPEDPINCDSNSVAACVTPAVTLYASLTPVTDLHPVADAPRSTIVAASSDKPAPGLFIRSQQLGDARVCVGQAKSTDCPANRLLVYLRGVPAPQLGQLRFLPFSSRMFEAAKLSLAMREDGSVEKFSYDRTKALASEAAAAAKDAVTQYEAYRDKQDKKAKDDLTAQRAEEIASIQHQIEVLNKQKELTKAQAPDTPDADAAIKAETASIAANVALLEAKLSQLKAEAALAQASSGGGGGE